MSNSLWPRRLQHPRPPCPPCPSLSPRVCSDSCPSSQWCHPTISIILCCPLLLLPSVFPRIRVFFNELVLHIRWPKYWSFSFSITPSKDYSGLTSLKIDWFDHVAVQGTLECSPTSQFKSINSSACSLLYGSTLTSIHDYWKNHSFDYTDLCWQNNVSAF